MENENPEARLKRLAMRAARRGTKEMDLVLGPYALAFLPEMDEARLALFDRLLWENDQDLLPWVLGQVPPPPDYAAMIDEIGAYARARLSPG